MTQENKLLPGKFELVYDSATIVAGDCPSIEFPAISFEKQDGAAPAGEAGPRLQVTPASLEELRESFLGLITGEFAERDAPAAARYIILVVPPDEFEYLCGRVRGIRKHPLQFELDADEKGRLLAARYDQRDCVYPSRTRSGVPGGPIDFEIDALTG
jgi:hypothetical protein